MHFGNLCIIEKPEGLTTTDAPADLLASLESAVERAMGPSEEHGGFWDWYQIGGRWTGALDDYDPMNDPTNLETCNGCNGTGTRDWTGTNSTPEWIAECNGCNGCHGTGKHPKWPTAWAKHAGDVQPIEKLTPEILDKFFRICTPNGTTFGGEDYLPWKPIGQMFPKRERPPAEWLRKEYAGHLMVVVDNHN